MTESVLTLYVDSGYTGWDNINNGYDGTPIIFNVPTASIEATFGIQNAAVAGVISKVTLKHRIQGGFPGYYYVTDRSVLYTHGARYEYSHGFLTGYYEPIQTLSEELATNPFTGAAWTWVEVDDMIAGIRLSIDWGTSCALYQYYVEVTYTPDVYTPSTLARGGPGIGCPMMF